MKQHKTIFTVATMLLMAGGLFTACSADLDTPSGNADGSQVYKMNIMAKKGGGASNRALAEDGGIIRAKWTTTDNVYVNKGSTWFTGSLQPQWEGKETLLSGSITGVSVNAGDQITLQYPKKGEITYDGQLGTLEDIAANFDWAVATTTVSEVDDDHNISTFNDVVFENQQAIQKLTLKDEDGNDLNAKKLKVISGNKTFTVTPASDTNEFYIAMPQSSGNITVTAYRNDGVFRGIGILSHGLIKGFYEQTTVDNWTPILFTVNSDGKAVMFSQGNLQYVSGSWKFAENQWDYLGDSQADDNRDLFGWGAWTNNSPNQTSTEADYTWNSIGDNLSIDGQTWSTLTSAEWEYLFNTRSSGSTVNGTSDARYTHATINTDGTSVNGMILFPDGITIANSEATSWGSINGNSAWGTKCTTAQWSALEAKGCVFLPASGQRYRSTVGGLGAYGFYWSSSPFSLNEGKAFDVNFYSDNLSPAVGNDRYYGYSVRLVHEQTKSVSTDAQNNDYSPVQHVWGDIEDAGDYIKIYDSATSGYMISKTDTQSDVQWSDIALWGTRDQWQAIMQICSGESYFIYTGGYNIVNDAVSNAGISGWSPLSGIYWTCSEAEGQVIIMDPTVNHLLSSRYYTHNVRTISAF